MGKDTHFYLAFGRVWELASVLWAERGKWGEREKRLGGRGWALELQPRSVSFTSVLGEQATPQDPVHRTSVFRAQWSAMDPGREEYP